MNKTIEGKANIKATVLAHSTCEKRTEMITYELEFPRMVLAELATHRMLSKNAASSRAIPFEKMEKQLIAEPVRFGEANPGMQDKGEDCYKLIWDDAENAYSPETMWQKAKQAALKYSKQFYKTGYHKQVYNRLTEPFQMIKIVLSGTEWDNFFWLRDDDAADPTIRELAVCMKKALEWSTPNLLQPGDWHLPYIESERGSSGKLKYYVWEVSKGDDQSYGMRIEKYLTVDEALKMSAARCAATSYRNENYELEKCEEVFARLMGSEKKHSSPTEHAATPIRGNQGCVNVSNNPNTWEKGITHMDRDYNLWSGNLKHWIQHRKLIPGENYVNT